MAGDQALQAKLNALSNSYRSQLPERLKEIDLLWHSVCRQQTVEGGGRELYRLVHSLAGSGASFGFPELSKAASAFESQLKECITNNLVIDEERQLLIDKQRKHFYTVLVESAKE